LKKTLITIVGPTAVGKTSFAIDLALKYSTEIISADSRQIYRQLKIGTAKPTHTQLALVKHHFIDYLNIDEDFNAGEFEKRAIETILDIFTRKDIAIMCGGSGLYINAVCHGIDEIPTVEPDLRELLIATFEKEGLAPLINELKLHDPQYYKQVDRSNPQRIIRALEVIRSTGKPYSKFRKRKNPKRPFRIIKIGLELDRSELYDSVDKRMDMMIKNGLFEEAKELFSYKELNALQTVGYKEIFGYLEGEYGKVEAIRLLKRNSRRYAKRQLTWFKKDDEVQWFNAGEVDAIMNYINSKVM